jgi:hypothetical protein
MNESPLPSILFCETFRVPFLLAALLLPAAPKKPRAGLVWRLLEYRGFKRPHYPS